MNIPHQSLIKKIEHELGKAKTAEKSQQIREHVYSIKALCEVLLEENNGASAQSTFSQPQQTMPYFQESQPVQKPVSIQKEEPLETDDGANGNSLFDF
ncbi:YwdI family protein [Rossellomorea vietnamensis]|uniref:YwdI family protein n=1 Tax=Rossellomorea vietnamensis TaxID=218284 RepID=UPI001E317E68|nr:YwdI family protein [Rossellomorea vietnamensis]MCC5803385.1 YwdI family protein [Rossellomorea vietnamensis]